MIYKSIALWDKKSGSGWHDNYGVNTRTAAEKQVSKDWVKSPDVSRYGKCHDGCMLIYMISMPPPQIICDEIMALLLKNAGIHAWYPTPRNPLL